MNVSFSFVSVNTNISTWFEIRHFNWSNFLDVDLMFRFPIITVLIFEVPTFHQYYLVCLKSVIESLDQASVSLFRWFENNLLKSNADKYHFIVSTSQEVSLNVNNFRIKTVTVKNF